MLKYLFVLLRICLATILGIACGLREACRGWA